MHRKWISILKFGTLFAALVILGQTEKFLKIEEMVMDLEKEGAQTGCLNEVIVTIQMSCRSA